MTSKASPKLDAFRQFSLITLFSLTASTAWALDNPPWEKLTTKVGLDAAVPGWYINLGITGARAMITKEEPTRLKVMFIFKDSLANGKLAMGDKITGVNQQPFITAHKFGYGVGKFGYQGPIMDFGNALEASQATPDGKLVIDLLRGEQNLQVELKLPIRSGALSVSYPYNCKKSDLLLKESCEWLQCDGLRLVCR